MFLDNPYTNSLPPVLLLRLRPAVCHAGTEICQDAVLGALASALFDLGDDLCFAWTIRSLSQRTSGSVYELVPLPDQPVSNAAASALAAALRRQPQIEAVESRFGALL